MCGICGLSYKNSPPEDTHRLLRKMTDLLTHRGPDADGYFSEHHTFMGMRRLSIIDLEGGTQPLTSEDGTLIAFQNGEIYNHPELREKIQTKHIFKTRSDTEILVHLYEEYGTDFLNHLNGMFSLALYDRKTKLLLLARDPLGVKPLYYTQTPSCFIYSSEIKPLLAHPDVSREYSRGALNNYLRHQYIPTPKTPFRNIHKLEPGTFLMIKEGVLLRKEPYFKMSPYSLSKDPENLSHELRTTLEQSVRMQLRSDVPLGLFLSGGLDSTLLTAIAANQSSQPVNTFTVGYENAGPLFDERDAARETARHFKTTHHEILIKPEIEENFIKVIQHLEEPAGDSSTFLTYAISRETARHVKVALSGTGGDELFGGYNRYLGAKLSGYYQRIPSFIRNQVLSPLLNHFPANRSTPLGNIVRQLKKLRDASDIPWFERYLQYSTLFSPESRTLLLTQSFQQELEQERKLTPEVPLFHQAPSFPQELDDLNKIMYYDCRTYLVDDLLFLADKTSMAHSLEIRVPFLDPNLVLLSLGIPSSMKIRGLQRKAILRSAFKDLVPHQLLNRKKIGFMAPIEQWLRKELKNTLNDLLSPERVRKRGLFNPEHIRYMLQTFNDQKEDYSQQIFSLMMLELWMQIFQDTP